MKYALKSDNHPGFFNREGAPYSFARWNATLDDATLFDSMGALLTFVQEESLRLDNVMSSAFVVVGVLELPTPLVDVEAINPDDEGDPNVGYALRCRCGKEYVAFGVPQIGWMLVPDALDATVFLSRAEAEQSLAQAETEMRADANPTQLEIVQLRRRLGPVRRRIVGYLD